MFESFVIMLREGIEAALVIGIIMVVLKRTARRGLERLVWRGLGLAALCITRASINDPKIILADEPTGNLDEANGERVLEIFRLFHKEEKTLVVGGDPRPGDRIRTPAKGASS